MAEVGLVGYPNAGKSTLLTAISKARPKVAPYPFTTLHPQIGIVEYADWHRLTVCDVPGLIEGAHRNVGLGHEFLRHIERCKILVLLLDMAGTDNRAPWDDYKQLLKELELYDPALLEKPRLVVANKMDEVAAEKNLKQFKKENQKGFTAADFWLHLTRALTNSRRPFGKRSRRRLQRRTGFQPVSNFTLPASCRIVFPARDKLSGERTFEDGDRRDACPTFHARKTASGCRRA